MRTLLAVCLLALVTPLAGPGCQTAPSARVVEVQTLKSVGQSAEAAVALSAQLYRDGKITSAQARQAIDFYNGRFQPVFVIAKNAVLGNLDSVASPELVSLAGQLSALIISFQSH